MQLISAPAYPVDGNDIIGLAVSDAAITAPIAGAAVTIVHEILHGMGLDHRGMTSQVQVPMYADLLNADQRDIMYQYNLGINSEDIDLLQLYAIKYSQYMI